jgi:hyperosmotically inducible protein
MLNKLSVGICGIAVVLMAFTAGSAGAQSTTDKAKASTKSTMHKTEEVIDDSAITTSIKTKLLADKKTSAVNISVETTNGVVTLSGPVTSSAERAEALKIAKQNKGVTRVVDKMTLEPKTKK